MSSSASASSGDPRRAESVSAGSHRRPGSASSSITPPRTPYGRVAAVATLMAAVVAVIVLAFSWPAVTSEPKNLPVAISGPADAVEQVESAVAEEAGGAVALERVGDREDAVAAIERRQVYGAIVLGDSPTAAPEVLIASAANAAVAQTLTGLAAQL